METPLDLLGLLHRLGFSITESASHTWYAYKRDGDKIFGCFSNDIIELYNLCTNKCPILPK